MVPPTRPFTFAASLRSLVPWSLQQTRVKCREMCEQRARVGCGESRRMGHGEGSGPPSGGSAVPYSSPLVAFHSGGGIRKIHLKMRKTGAPFNAGGEEGGPGEGKVADQERRGQWREGSRTAGP